MTSDFTLEFRRAELRFRRVHLASRTRITPQYVRVRVEGGDLRGFDSAGADDHIRIFFPGDEISSLEELRASPSREYTPLAWNGEMGWLDLEFAVHGDEGIAARWAAQAPIGSPAAVGGPRGSTVIVGRPDFWFLAGDETAVPAIRRFVQSMDAAASGRILIEVPDAEHEIALDVPAGIEVVFVHRGSEPSGPVLAASLDALGAGNRPDGSVFGFIAAEQSIVKPGRALLLDRWRLDSAHVVVKGYWKRGETEYHAPH